MVNRAPEKLKRCHVVLFESDYDWLMSIYGGPDRKGMSAAVRLIIRSFIKRVEDKRQTQAKAQPQTQAVADTELDLSQEADV